MGPSAGLIPVISQLRDHLAFRRMECGMRTLAAHAPAIQAIEPSQPNAGVLLGLVAQWVDAGFAGPELVRELLARFPATRRAELALLDYLHVRLAEGMVAMAGEDFALATQHFRFVESLEGEMNDPELLAICKFWTARSLRQLGRYDDAVGFAIEANRLALDSGYAPMAAIMQSLESWLAFQKGRLNEALRLLQEAETALGGTDDFITRGNIQSAYGRIARRQARYDQALEYFNRAIAEYFETAATVSGDPKTAANWVMGDLMGLLKAEGKEISESPVSARQLGELVGLVAKGEVSGKLAKEIFGKMFSSGESAGAIVERDGLKQISDAGALEKTIADVIANNPKQVEQYRGGKATVLNFLVGQAMRATRGQANVAVVTELFKQKLG